MYSMSSATCRRITHQYSVRNLVLTLALLCFTAACSSTSPRSVTPPPSAAGDTAIKSIYQVAAPAAAQWRAAEVQLRADVKAEPQSVNAHSRLAVLYRQMEHFDKAQSALNTAMQLSDGAIEVHNELGILQRSQGQFAEAKNTFESILQRNPAYANAHFNLGILYDLYLREPVQAHAHYEAYLESATQADVRVEKWLVDLQRRYGIDANTSMVQVSE